VDGGYGYVSHCPSTYVQAVTVPSLDATAKYRQQAEQARNVTA